MKKDDVVVLINNFLNRLEKEGGAIESIVVSTSKGKFFDKYYLPKHRRNIYSHSKTYVSFAFGIALEEGLLHLDNHLVDYIKDEITPEQYDEFYKIKVRHLLTMTSGFGEGLLMKNDRLGIDDYLSFILSHLLKYEPGTFFWYSNADTYLLVRMLEKAFQKSLLDVVSERFLNPMGIFNAVWEKDAQGHCFGASGLELDCEEMNKLGILFLNKGKHNGKQLISESYIDTLLNTVVNTNNWEWGDYSYQMWHTPEGNGIRADGAFGQLTIIYPKQDLAISIQRSEDDKFGITKKILVEEVLNKL